jgi:hypothetical protein
MPGSKALRKIQLGHESTAAGTAIAATVMWRGEGTVQDTQEVVHPPEDVGNLMGYDRTYIPTVGAEITFDETPATFEHLPYILEAGVETETPTQDGSGSDYIYTYNFPTTAQRTIKTYTIEHGDDQQAEEVAYCFVREFSLTGAVSEALMMSATWEGRETDTTTYTSLTPVTVEEILFQKGEVYIDGVSTFPATTKKSNTFVSMELSVTTGHVAYRVGDGNLYFSASKQIQPEVTLGVTFEHDSTAVAEIAAWRAETPRSIRIEFTGAAVETAGTTYSNKQLFIDLVGKWETFSSLEDNDGNDVVTGTLRARYNSTASSSGRFIVVNELSALT